MPTGLSRSMEPGRLRMHSASGCHSCFDPSSLCCLVLSVQAHQSGGLSSIVLAKPQARQLFTARGLDHRLPSTASDVRDCQIVQAMQRRMTQAFLTPHSTPLLLQDRLQNRGTQSSPCSARLATPGQLRSRRPHPHPQTSRAPRNLLQTEHLALRLRQHTPVLKGKQKSSGAVIQSQKEQ